jgi:hypothetical protein
MMYEMTVNDEINAMSGTRESVWVAEMAKKEKK